MALPLNTFTLDNVSVLDVAVKFIIFASLIYLLYKFFIIDLTIKYILDNAPSHIAIYKSKLLELASLDKINAYLDTLIEEYSAAENNADPSTNDANMMIIFITMIFLVFIIALFVIIYFGDITDINLHALFYNNLFTIVLLVVSQLLFFYIIYQYFDPIILYKVLYQPYNVIPQTAEAFAGTQGKGNIISVPTSDRKVNLTDYNTAIVFSFTVISGVCFFLALVALLLSGLSVYGGIHFKYVSPGLNSSLAFKIICVITAVFLFAFITLLILLLSRL